MLVGKIEDVQLRKQSKHALRPLNRRTRAIRIEIQAGAVADWTGAWRRNHQAKRYRKSDVVASRVGLFAFTKSGDAICDRSASYRAKNAASMSPGLRHLGSTRRGPVPRSQALARAYKTFACTASSFNISAHGSSIRRLRVDSAVCLIKTSKSGKRMASRVPRDAVAIGGLFPKIMRRFARF